MQPICRTCGEPIRRDWAPTDPTLREYHAGCRPGAGRIPATPHDPRLCGQCAEDEYR